MSQSVRVGLQLTSADPFWVEVRDAIYQYCQQQRVDLVPFEIDMTRFSGEEQMTLVEDLLAQELDALITQNIAPQLLGTVLDAGVPVVSLSEITLRHPLATCPRGLYDAALLLGSFLADELQGTGRVLIVGGMREGTDSGSSRVRGFREVFGRHPGLTLLHTPTPWDYEGAFEATREAIERQGLRFDAIAGLSDSLALAGRDACRALGYGDERSVIGGINGDTLALAAILKGEMQATVETPAADFGRRAMDLACQAARGEPLPRTFRQYPRLVTRRNVIEVAVEKLIAIANLPTRLVGISRQQQQHRLTQLETSLAINRRVGAILDRNQLRDQIADIIRSNYRYDDVQVFSWSDREKEFVLDQPRESPGEPIRIPLAESGLLGDTLLRNRPTFIPDMRHSHRFPPDPYWPSTQSRVILPIRHGKEILGLLDLHSRRPTQHTHQDLIGLQALADHLGIAMRNAQLYGEAIAAHAEARRADEIKSRLLANISHGLRTPLNVILGYSQSALAEPNPYGIDLPPELRRDLRYIRDSGEHLVRLINHLLDLSRAEIGALDLIIEPIATRPFLEDLFHSMAGSSSNSSDVEWRLHLPAELPAIQADPLRLRQVLFNLLSNARKFTERGHITLGALPMPTHLQLWVEDTGAGIPAEKQARIFEAFVTAEEPRQAAEGLGLGLRIAHEIVKLHGGVIWLKSTPGVGSAFFLRLPIAVPDRPLPEQETPIEPATAPLLPFVPGDLPPGLGKITRQYIDSISREYDTPISRRELAQEMGVSENYLSRIFRREVGLTPWQYLTRYRIQQAQVLLATTSLSITEIASRVGYADPAYFSRVFRRETGRSASAYRKHSKRS